MDSSKFDRLSRMFATRHGRRAAAAGLGSVLAGLVTRVAGPEAAEARPAVCRPRGGRCFPDHGVDCCQGTTCRNGRCRVTKRGNPRCKPTRNRCCRNGDCPANQICAKRRCKCCPNQKRCGNRCIAQNACCGGCGTSERCVAGACVDRCGDVTCGANERCVAGSCVPSCGHGRLCRVFVSSAHATGDFGGLAGADQWCQEQADATPALEDGRFRAWLSTSTASPSTRFSHLPDSGPFELLTGDAIANTWADLISGTGLLAAFNVQADGSTVQAVPLTNTTEFGTPAGGPDCDGWTTGDPSVSGRVGDTLATDANWTEYADRQCHQSLRLYCIEQR